MRTIKEQIKFKKKNGFVSRVRDQQNNLYLLITDQTSNRKITTLLFTFGELPKLRVSVMTYIVRFLHDMAKYELCESTN